MGTLLLLYIFIAVPCAFITAAKAKRMNQSWGNWFIAGLALPVISLAIVQYFESDWEKRDPR